MKPQEQSESQHHQHSTAEPSAFAVRGLALMSGFLGASASCFAKLASFDADRRTDHVMARWFQLLVFCGDETAASRRDALFCSLFEIYLPRGLCIAAVVLCNAGMLGSFLQGMEESGSVAATALSSAANFVASAAFGYCLWEEEFNAHWWLGFSMVLLGVMLLSTVRPVADGDDGRQKPKPPLSQPAETTATKKTK